MTTTNFNIGYNVLGTAVTGYAGLLALLGVALSGEVLWQKWDDLAIVLIAIATVVWYFKFADKAAKSPIPLIAVGLDTLIIGIAFVLEAMTESVYDELITLPALAIVLIIMAYGYITQADSTETSTTLTV